MRRQIGNNIENKENIDKKNIKNTRHAKDKKKKRRIGLKFFITILVILRHSIWNISKKST